MAISHPDFDIRTATACPKCALEAKTLLHRFCTHADCPVRAALKAPKTAPAETYRGYQIYFDPPPIPTRNCDWHFVHDDYDGAPNEPDEGPADHRCGSGSSIEDCKAQIDDIDDIEDDA
jgi:hypothetical protein